MKTGLVGPSYQELSLPFDAQRTINMYPVLDDMGKEKAALYGVPGLALFATCGTGSGRKTFQSENGRAFVVAGAGLYEVLADGSSVLRGALEQTEGNVTIAENPTQLAICDGQNLFILIYSSNAFAKVTDGDLPHPVATVTFKDGFFIIVEGGSGRFYISAFNDGTAWNALDFATAESAPDSLRLAMGALGQLWLLGVFTTEVWSNTGSADFPFRRMSGATVDVGIMSAHTAVVVDNSLMFLGQSKEGSGVVYRARGLTPERVSTAAIEQAIQRAGSLEVCVGYSYHQNGHWFYAITGGGLATTFVYDLTSQQWHERARLTDEGEYEQHIVRDMMMAFGLHLGVDRRDGRVYRVDETLYDNAGEVRCCERIFTHLGDEDKRVVYNRLVIGAESGVGLQSGQGSDPKISLRLSKDGARTWSNWFSTSLGRTGEYRNKAVFRRLGMAEQITFNVRITDPVKVAITGAYLS